MTNADWRIVPLDETLLAQWATLRQQLWPHHALSAHLQDGAELLANAHLSTFLVLDEQSQAVAFADAALRHDYVNGCESSRVTQWGRELGCRELASDAAIDNLASQQLHQRLGFAETERVVFFKKALG